MSSPDTPRKTTRKIAKRACDQCKLRKIKCSLLQPCKACVSMNFECTFIQPQKKRGPVGHRVSQIRQQQKPADSLTATLPYGGAPGSAHSMHNGAPWPVHSESASVPTDLSQPPATVPVATAWELDASSTDSLGHHNAATWDERDDAEYWLPDTIDAQMPVFNFLHNNIYLKNSLPSIIQPDPHSAVLHPHQTGGPSAVPTPNMGASPPTLNDTGSLWPSSIIEANMIPWIDVYFDRLHATLPVLSRSSLFTRMLSYEHRSNPQFGSMLLALCAFSLTQPIEINERSTQFSRANQARSMMNEAIKMRSCSDFCKHPTIEAVLTSFFLFGCLFGSNQHNAAWLRLREALDLAAALGLNNPNSYGDLPSAERGQYLRTFLVLSITERAYALQHRHSITFWGRPSLSLSSVYDLIHSAASSVVSGIIVHNERDAEGLLGLAKLMELFDAIDENVLDCWNRRCNITHGYCEKLTTAKALSIHQNLSRLNRSEWLGGYDWFERSKLAHAPGNHIPPIMSLRESQCADVFITQKWLQNRVWVLCFGHGLLMPASEHHELCFNYAVTVAEETLQICQRLHLSSMEAHGIGLVEKLYDIAISAISVLFNIPLPSPNYPNTDPADPTVPERVSPPQDLTPPIPQADATTPISQSLAEDFLLQLSSLRGGNHPFLPKYKEFLQAAHVIS